MNSIITECVDKQQFYTVCVEGNIGCGKTTFLSHFADNQLVEIVEEPVARWQNAGGHNLLKLMYNDPQKWGFAFQTHVQLTMLQNHVLPQQRPIKMIERSLHSGRKCFVENLFMSGVVCGEETAVLDEWYQWMCQRGYLHVDLFIYLRSSPRIVQERVKARARQEENSAVDLSLLQRIHDLHEDWLMDQDQKTPVFVVDADRPLPEMPAEYEKCSQALLRLCQKSNGGES